MNLTSWIFCNSIAKTQRRNDQFRNLARISYISVYLEIRHNLTRIDLKPVLIQAPSPLQKLLIFQIENHFALCSYIHSYLETVGTLGPMKMNNLKEILIGY